MTCGLVWLLGLATIGLAVAGRVPPPQFVTSYMALGPLFGMPAALLGARIVQQRHGHRMGWILLAMGLTQTIAQTANAYSWLSINRHEGGLPGTALATWVIFFAWMPCFALGPYLLLLFPNGRLPGRGWRPAAWGGGAAMAALIAASAVLAWPVRGTTLYQNTQGQVALAPLDALEGLLHVVGDALMVVAAVALVVRLRGLRGAERQQTKWFAFGAIPWVAVDLAWVAVQLTGGVVLPAAPLAAGLGELVAASGLLGALTGPATTRPGPSRGSVPACARRSIWTSSPPSWSRWSTRRWSRPRCGCGCDRGLVLRRSVGCALADHQLAVAHPVVDTRVGTGPPVLRPRTGAAGDHPQGRP